MNNKEIEILGKLTNKEINDYKEADKLPTDKERQVGYAKVWDSIKKRIKLPIDHRFIINSVWEIIDAGKGIKKK